MFDRMQRALRRRGSDDEARAASQIGRLFVLANDDRQAHSEAAAIEELPVRYIVSSDTQLVAAHTAEWCDEAQLSSDRREGKFIVSYKTSGGWVAITKNVLTEVLGAGRDVKIVGLPPGAAGALTSLYPGLTVLLRI
jgi:hypothetical protein